MISFLLRIRHTQGDEPDEYVFEADTNEEARSRAERDHGEEMRVSHRAELFEMRLWSVRTWIRADA